MEDSAARDEHVGAVFNADGRRLGVHPAVHLEQDAAPALIECMPEGTELVHLLGHEMLSAETRLHRHDEDQVDKVQVRPGRLPGGRRLQRDAAALSLVLYEPERSLDLLGSVGLDMDIDQVRTCPAECLRIADRFGDHQVGVQEHARGLPDRFENGNAHGDIRHEAAVHHIIVEPVGAGEPDILHFLRKARKIGRQKRRSDTNHMSTSV